MYYNIRETESAIIEAVVGCVEQELQQAEAEGKGVSKMRLH